MSIWSERTAASVAAFLKDHSKQNEPSQLKKQPLMYIRKTVTEKSVAVFLL